MGHYALKWKEQVVEDLLRALCSRVGHADAELLAWAPWIGDLCDDLLDWAVWLDGDRDDFEKRSV